MTSQLTSPEADANTITAGQRTLTNLMAERLIQRRDVKAIQGADGAYSPVRDPVTRANSRFTLSDLVRHTQGQATYGHYVVDQAGLCRTLAFDIDFAKEYPWRGESLNPRDIFGTDHPARAELNRYIRGMADGLAWRLKRYFPKLIVITSFSGGKGIHVYGCYEKPTTAEAAREQALQVLNSFECFEAIRGKSFYQHVSEYDCLTIEVFPKQEKIGQGGFGNLLRLPLGVHMKSRRRAFFYDPRSEVQELRPTDPIPALLYGTVRPK